MVKCMGTRKVCMARSIARWLASGWQQAPAYAEASESRDGKRPMRPWTIDHGP